LRQLETEEQGKPLGVVAGPGTYVVKQMSEAAHNYRCLNRPGVGAASPIEEYFNPFADHDSRYGICAMALK